MTGSSRPNLEVLANRHLCTPRGSHEIIRPPRELTVRLTLSREAATRRECQLTACALASLLARQFALLHQIQIDVPHLPVLPNLYPLGGADYLDDRLAEIVELIGEGHIHAESVSRSIQAADVQIVIGPGGTPVPGAALYIGVLGLDWKVYLGPIQGVPEELGTTENPIGPLFAATLAAGEVFRQASSLADMHHDWQSEPLILSLWSMEAHKLWLDLPSGSWSPEQSLPPFYLVGAGAVGQAMGLCLAASGLRSGQITLIDEDMVDETNLNRYPLSHGQDIGRSKVEVLATHLRSAGFEVLSFPGYWDKFLACVPLPDQPRELWALENEYKFEWVLSCVDKNVARRAIQNSQPRFLLGASTYDFRVQVASYSPVSGHECLKCHHPAEPAPLAPDELSKALRGLSEVELRRLASTRGVPLEEIKTFLGMDHKCGTLSPAAIERLQAFGGTDMTVGHVSLAAGVLLFREFWMAASAHPPHKPGCNAHMFGFAPLRGQDTVRAKVAGCGCSGVDVDNYLRRWGPIRLPPQNCIERGI